MAKIIAVYGSPRRQGNTATLLKRAVTGAVDTGAEVIAVACPYCLQMFEETVKAMNLNIPVLDVTEILDESVDEKEELE